MNQPCTLKCEIILEEGVDQNFFKKSYTWQYNEELIAKRDKQPDAERDTLHPLQVSDVSKYSCDVTLRSGSYSTSLPKSRGMYTIV